jgi:RNA polymerase sigma-70 factor (ECF subfamily)
MTGSDDELFTALFEESYADVLRYAVRRAPEASDAADVAAETFVVAWRRRHDLPPPSERRAWLFGVARNVLANQARSQERRDRLRSRLLADRAVAAPAAAAGGVAGRVAEAFAALAARDREVLALVAWEGLRPEEVAVALGVSPATARVRLHRARKRFAAALQEQQPAAAEEDRWAAQALLAGEAR